MDLPVVNKDGTLSFTWNDGPVLKAIKEGHWILLDEVNFGGIRLPRCMTLYFSIFR